MDFPQVWPDGEAVFPDFFLSETRDWWMESVYIHYTEDVGFDGIWIVRTSQRQGYKSDSD